jgi:hypothetical protein
VTWQFGSIIDTWLKDINVFVTHSNSWTWCQMLSQYSIICSWFTNISWSSCILMGKKKSFILHICSKVFDFQSTPCQYIYIYIYIYIRIPYNCDFITLLIILRHASQRISVWIVVLKRDNAFQIFFRNCKSIKDFMNISKANWFNFSMHKAFEMQGFTSSCLIVTMTTVHHYSFFCFWK